MASEFWKFVLVMIGFPMLCGLAGMIGYTVYILWYRWLFGDRRNEKEKP